MRMFLRKLKKRMDPRRQLLWKIINDSANGGLLWANKIHPIHGLRCIKDFERINGIKFDPFNSAHRSKVGWGMGRIGSGIRDGKRHIEAMRQAEENQ